MFINPAHLAASICMSREEQPITPEKQLDAIAQIRAALGMAKPPVKVLVVEDNDKDAEMTLGSLRDVPVAAHWARDSKETEDYLVSNDPWLIFLDLQLGAPGVGAEMGLNVLGLIKAYKPDSHVVVLTGQYRHDSADCVAALSKGAKMVMLKPFTPEDARLLFTAP